MNPKLLDAIEEFKAIAQARGWDTQIGAFQWCADASDEFEMHCRDYRLRPKIEVFNGLPQEAIDAISLLGKPSLIDDEGTGHVVVFVQGVYVDWTARQFYPGKPFPVIWTLQEMNAAGWFRDEDLKASPATA